MTVVLLAVGPPGILPIYSPRPGYLDLTDVLRFVDPIAVIASSIYAVERLIRRRATLWQFSLKELLIAVTTICLAISVVATQYREAQRLDEIIRHGAGVDFVSPPLWARHGFLGSLSCSGWCVWPTRSLSAHCGEYERRSGG